LSTFTTDAKQTTRLCSAFYVSCERGTARNCGTADAGSSQSISAGRRAHGSKLAAAACGGRMGQTEGRTDGRPTDAQTLLRVRASSTTASPSDVIVT